MRPGDLPALHRIVTHPATARMLPAFDAAMTLEDCEVPLAGEALFLLMRLVAWHSGLVSGSVAPSAGDLSSLSYVVDPALWGGGLPRKWSQPSWPRSSRASGRVNCGSVRSTITLPRSGSCDGLDSGLSAGR